MQDSFAHLQCIIEAALLTHLPQCRHQGTKALDDALRYTVFSGGKRIRPILSILAARVFCSDPNLALLAACGVEFTHTSSLIYDDLPCMDNAQLRRGVPTLHLVYGEDVALLAGIALLNQSYAIFGQSPDLIAEATQCIGVNGMIGGQALDLSLHAEGDKPLDERLRELAERNRKTSAMMRLALTAGPLACGTPQAEVAPLGSAGQSLGEAYQIADDLLDAGISGNSTAKTPGQDERHHRLTHGTLGQQASLQQMEGLIERARQSLREAYGTSRVAGLVACVDAIFADVMNEIEVAQ